MKIFMNYLWIAPQSAVRNRPTRERRPLAYWLRAVAGLLVPVFGVSCIPNYLLAQVPVVAREASRELKMAADALAAPTISINRTLPPGALLNNSAPAFVLSDQPSDDELRKARVFPESIIPDGPGKASDNEAISKALRAYAKAPVPGNLDVVADFLRANPKSPWAVAIWLNLGLVYRQTGYFTQALNAWEQAWRLGKSSKTPMLQPLVDRSVAELAELNARLGRYERLRPLFAELDALKRDVRGAAAEKIGGAREGLWLMENKPEDAFRCGPMALLRIQLHKDSAAPLDQRILKSRSTMQGMSLPQVAGLSKEIGMPMVMAKRDSGAPFLMPAMVHWKVGHYAALLEERNGGFRVEDPTFGDQLFVSRAALDAETSGYFLVPQDKILPAGWRYVEESEGETVWGKGNTGSNDPNRTGLGDVSVKSCPNDRGMAAYDVNALLVSLAISDVPLSYSPPRGPSIAFSLRYAQREANQPTSFNYWNFGNRWTCNWLSYIIDNHQYTWNGTTFVATGGSSSAPKTYLQGGGTEDYASSVISPTGDPNTVHWSPGPYGNVELVQTGADRFERRYYNGAKQVFSQIELASTFPRKVFLTQEIDPYGNSVSYGYDSSLRLIAVTDALGQVTTLTYGMTADPLKVTQVTDPFGRLARLEYDAQSTAGRVNKIVDSAGYESTFVYGTSDFINSMTTPYGTTSFVRADVTTDSTLGTTRWLEVTDPYGDRERTEYRDAAPGIPGSEADVPATIPTFNSYLNYRNAFYWDKKAYKEANAGDNTARDYLKASLFHFLHDYNINVTSGILESTKQAFENRVWFSYWGQSSALQINAGMRPMQKHIGRIVENAGTTATQLTQITYNTTDRPLTVTDPLGRVMTYVYATNGFDLLEARRTTTGLNELLAKYTYDLGHQPLTVTDASNQTTTYTYNSFGQVKTVTNAKSEVTTFNYDAVGYPQTVVSPQVGAYVSYGYDGFKRVNAVTSYPDVDTVQVGYEARGGDPLKTLNRPLTVTYPDGTFTQVVYDRMHVEYSQDQGGNWSHYLANNLGQIEAVIDPLGQITQMTYCKCGAMQTLTDPGGNITRWAYDAQGRTKSKTYADNTVVSFAYEPRSGRLLNVTDAKNQITNFFYFLDNALASVSYTNAAIATPGVSYTYDAQRGRLLAMLDQYGTTSYGYNPIPATSPPLGSGRLASVDGPWTNDTITYTYDELGRTNGRAVNGVGRAWGWDNLGRSTTDTGPLGAFTYDYESSTGRLSRVSSTSGPTTALSYLDRTQSRRLSQILHTGPSSTLYSQFNYAQYDPLGRIGLWTQAQGTNPAQDYAFGYDTVGQLKSATIAAAGTQNVSSRQFFAFDAAGNRTGKQDGNAVLGATPTNTNALFSTTGGGPTRIAGTLSEYANVTINSVAASTTGSPGNYGFAGSANLPPGDNVVTVVATDPSGNATNKQYRITTTAADGSATFQHDLNGNMTRWTPLVGQEMTFEYDAADRCIAIIKGFHRTDFGYDGAGRRVKIIEMENGIILTVIERTYVYDGMERLEERDAAGTTSLRRFFPQGEQRLGGADAGNYFYTRDHLGSVRELVDAAGAVRARYKYAVWGERTKLAGDLDTEIGFTAYWHNVASGLLISPTRLYSAALGRFLSRDPIQEAGGGNLYAYILGNPSTFTDPLGLRIVAHYWITAHQLYLYDTERQTSITVNMRSGSWDSKNDPDRTWVKSKTDGGEAGPLPVGEYRITSWQDKHDMKAYALVPIDDTPHDMMVQVMGPYGPVMRGLFLIHLGKPAGIGCITTWTGRDAAGNETVYDTANMQKLIDFFSATQPVGPWRIDNASPSVHGTYTQFGTISVHR